MPLQLDDEVATQVHIIEDIGEQLAVPIGSDLDPNPSDLLLIGSLGDKLVANLREWRSGPKLEPVNIGLLKVLRTHGHENGWTPKQTSGAERKLRLLLRRIRQKDPGATEAVIKKRRKRRRE